MATKFIFITGGVVSGLGKGITAASLGRLLKERGLKVTIQKFDPYINVDSGTLNPYQHGEVFVTHDGAETDLDLGHYERFIDENLDKRASVTSGKVYQAVIARERAGDYDGGTVQVVPHITEEISSCVKRAADGVDVVITEIGGTVGDIESQPFLEALRQLKVQLPPEDCSFIHVTLLPIISPSNEIKTKPTQHSVRELSSMGIQPDFLICRCDIKIPQEQREKISLQCSVKPDHVIQNILAKSIYEVPLMLEREGLADRVCEDLRLDTPRPTLTDWEATVKRILNPQGAVEIALCGKYIDLHDAYLSIEEALQHAGIPHDVQVNIRWVPADALNEGNIEEKLHGVDGILIPGGFGDRGGEGKMLSAKYARENNIPFFGICLGLHMAVSEFARNVANLGRANTTEFDQATPYPVICLMPDQEGKQIGGTMRLGAQPCRLEKGSRAYAAYGQADIMERHRHRYEVNAEYIDILEEKGLRFTGINPEKNLVEIIEIPDHPWFVGVQFHPEFLSRPNRPHPLFREFIGAAKVHREG